MADRAIRRAVHFTLAGGVWVSAALMAAGLLAGRDRLVLGGLFVLLCTPALRVTLLAGDYLRRRDWSFFWVSAGVLGMMAFGMRFGRGH